MVLNTGVYLITHRRTGRRYVGSAVDLRKRWKEHRRGLASGKHHSRFLQRQWAKDGAEAFEFTVALYCDRENLLMYEQALIDFYRPAFNSAPTAGSQLGLKMSPESRAKLSAAAKRTRNFTGHRHSEAAKQRISENRKGKGNSGWTQERRDKIARANTGRVVSPEQRAKIAAALRGHKQSPEQIAKRMATIRERRRVA